VAKTAVRKRGDGHASAVGGRIRCVVELSA